MEDQAVVLPESLPTEPEEAELSWTKKLNKANKLATNDKILAVRMFFLAFVREATFGILKPAANYGVGVLLAAVAYVVCLLLYARKQGRSIPAVGYFWMAVLVSFAAPYFFLHH